MIHALATMTQVELHKISRRVDSYLLILMSFLPVFFAVGIHSGSDNFIVNLAGATCLDWIQIMLIMLHQVFVFYMVVAIISTRTLSSEIDDHSLALYVPRVNNRGLIYGAKSLALFIWIAASLVAFFAVSTATYYAFLTTDATLTSRDFADTSRLSQQLAVLASVGLFLMLSLSLALCLSTYLRPLPCIGSAVLVMAILSFSSGYAPMAYASPQFYLGRMLDLLGNEISSGGQPLMSIPLFTDDFMIVFLLCCGVSLAWMTLSAVLGVVKFRSRDL